MSDVIVLETEMYYHPSSKQRIRLVQKLLEPQATDKILDVGCGDGDVTKELPGEIHGIELLKTRVERAKKNGVKCVHGSANKLPWKENTFDKAICSEVLEHVFNPGVIIDEIYRVLKPGGYCVFSVPYKEKFLSREHLRKYSTEILTDQLIIHGFHRFDIFYSSKYVLRHALLFPFKKIMPDIVYKRTSEPHVLIIKAQVKK